MDFTLSQPGAWERVDDTGTFTVTAEMMAGFFRLAVEAVQLPDSGILPTDGWTRSNTKGIHAK